VGCSLQGALAHAKNGDEVFWEEKFHASNVKAQACTQGALLFFLLCFGGGGGRDFFSFFPASQCVHTMFLSSSQWVPNIFPNIFSIPPHFYPICLGKWCPPLTLIGGPKGRNCTVQNRAFCFGESPLFLFFWSDEPIKLARRQKKKK
jgi:hypothetical protein